MQKGNEAWRHLKKDQAMEASLFFGQCHPSQANMLLSGGCPDAAAQVPVATEAAEGECWW